MLAYADALVDLVGSIKFGRKLEDQSLETLVEAERFDSDRKRLVTGLKCAGLVTDEQAAFAIGYRWPLKEA